MTKSRFARALCVGALTFGSVGATAAAAPSAMAREAVSSASTRAAADINYWGYWDRRETCAGAGFDANHTYSYLNNRRIYIFSFHCLYFPSPWAANGHKLFILYHWA